MTALQRAAPSEPDRGTLIEAMSIARQSVALFTDFPIDAVVSCKAEASGWRVVVDVVEAPARLGDNDLLLSYALTLSATGEVEDFSRLRRYHREDPAGAAP